LPQREPSEVLLRQNVFSGSLRGSVKTKAVRGDRDEGLEDTQTERFCDGRCALGVVELKGGLDNV
jgi:hypothetical protein